MTTKELIAGVNFETEKQIDRKNRKRERGAKRTTLLTKRSSKSYNRKRTHPKVSSILPYKRK